jgi:hypothetical protein
VKTDKPQRPNQTVTVSALALPDLGEGDPIMVDISCFTTAKILGKRSSPSEVKYMCQLEPLWLAADLVEEMPMGGVRLRTYENGLVREARVGTLRSNKRKLSQM